jgi:hypothetical protein
MADNINTQELQDALDRLTDAINDASGIARPLNLLGKSSAEAAAEIDLMGNAAAQNAQATRVSVQRQRELAQAADSAAGAMGDLAGSVFKAAKAMYEGQKGAGAFSGALDSLTSVVAGVGTALALLLPGGVLMKGVVAGVTFLTTALIGTAKEAGKMSDALFKGYQGLSQSGAAASDGLTGLLSDVHKLGMGFQDLERYNSIIAEGRKELVLFGGTVFEGRRRFADMGSAMAPFRESLMNAGMTQEEINEASMGYLRLQSRIGQTQNRTTAELAESTRKYLIEQDALTKLTGLTRKEQEDAREEIRSQERFAATLADMRAKGQTREAKELEDAYLILRSQSKEAAQGFADLSTGMITTEAAQKSMLATQGDSMRAAQKIQAGQLDAAEAAQKVAAAHGRTAESMRPLAQMGVYGNVIGDFAADLRLGALAEGDLVAMRKKITEEQEKQGATGKKAADNLVQQQTDLVLAQQRQMIATQDLISKAIEPSMTVFQRMMIIVEQVTLGLEKMLDYLGLFGKAKTTEQKEADIAVEKAESLVYQERMKIVDAERALMQARREGNKEQMQAAAETLEAAKASKKAADRALLDAEVRKKYADDRAAGRTGVGMGGQQIRADGSPINPGDADYVPPSAPAAGGAAVPGSGGGGGTAAPAAGAAAGGKNEAEQQMRPQDLFNFLGDITGHESNYNRLDSQFRERLTAMAKEYHAVTGGKKLPFGSGARNEEENRQVGGVGSSRHLKGTAVDLSTDAVNELVKLGLLGKHGFRQNPKSAWHISDDGFAKGGIATGPKSGYNALLHGTEAVVPLPDGKTIPVNMNESAAAVDNTEMLQVLREVKASMDSMINRADNQRVVDALENSIRTQRTSNDILGKILQMSQ